MIEIDFKPISEPYDQDLIILFSSDHEVLIQRMQPTPWSSFSKAGEVKQYCDLGQAIYIGGIIDPLIAENRNLWAINLAKDNQAKSIDDLIVKGLQKTSLRTLLRDGMTEEKNAMFRAMHLIRWSDKIRNCAHCGANLIWSSTEMAKSCPSCEETWYPTISPAIIVAIIKGTEILLCRARNRTGDWHSLVAGYVEAGESLEETVRREVREEVGLEIGEPVYQGSQSWPFSLSLMLAFRAEYIQGEITIQESELESAAWFDIARLPKTPPPPSIAHMLIERIRHSSWRSANRAFF